MRLLIVNLHLDIGGVETLLIRLIPLLHKAGIDVTLLVLQNRINSEFLTALSPCCTIKYVGDAFPFDRRKLNQFFAGEFDVAFYTISQALLIGSWLLSRAGYVKTRTVLGAFQTEIFCAESEGWRYHRKLVQNLIRDLIPASSIIFGNLAGRDFHANKLGVGLDEAPIIQLFVDIEKYQYKSKRGLKRNKIISIGRVTEYKTYNFTMLTVIRNLRDAGFDLEWHVYGDGEQLEKFRKLVMELKLENAVFAHGALNYSRFQSVLDDAFLFVGSGTSLIEAAACGVPALTTIEYCKEAHTYGYISEIQGFNMIEPGLDKPVHSLEERIAELVACSDEKYVEIQEGGYAKACQYSGKNIVGEYVDVFRGAMGKGVSVRISSPQIFLYGVSAVLGHIVNRFRSISSRYHSIS